MFEYREALGSSFCTFFVSGFTFGLVICIMCEMMSRVFFGPAGRIARSMGYTHES